MEVSFDTDNCKLLSENPDNSFGIGISNGVISSESHAGRTYVQISGCCAYCLGYLQDYFVSNTIKKV